MLTEFRLPALQQNTTSPTFVPIDGTSVRLSVIEREAVVELEFAGVYQHEATAIPGGAINLPAVQAQRVTAFVLPDVAGLNDLPLDQTDVENNVTVLEHDNVNIERILIKQTGLYQLTYMVGHDPSGASTYAFQLTLNGTTEIGGSRITHNISSQETDLSAVVLANLTAGDYVTFQADSGGATGSEIEHATVTATRLQSAEVASSGAEVHLSFFVNDVDVAAPYTDGLISHTANSEGQQIVLRYRTMLQPGNYRAYVVWKTNNTTGLGAKLRADVYPATMNVEVRSNPGTLGHGVDAKPQGVY